MYVCIVFHGAMGAGFGGGRVDAAFPPPQPAPVAAQKAISANTLDSSLSAAAKPQLRTLFPETWLWIDEMTE